MKLSRRKRLKHFNLPGHCHELTFSCYQRRPLLTNDGWLSMLSRSIDAAIARHSYRLVGFVFMPEHLHMIVWPERQDYAIEGLLRAIKRPFSFRIKQTLIDTKSPLLEVLTVRERPGKSSFRFWQEGAGYDRNLTSAESVSAALDYLHLNPVRRELALSSTAWRWSSVHFYVAGQNRDSELPRVSPLPAEFWNLPK
jgi:putative transposase